MSFALLHEIEVPRPWGKPTVVDFFLESLERGSIGCGSICDAVALPQDDIVDPLCRFDRALIAEFE